MYLIAVVLFALATIVFMVEWVRANFESWTAFGLALVSGGLLAIAIKFLQDVGNI